MLKLSTQISNKLALRSGSNGSTLQSSVSAWMPAKPA
jgi:hypothetical protein